MKSYYKKKVVSAVDNVIGDIIDEILDKYYSDYVETKYEYERLLYKIVERVKQEVFNNNATPEDVIEYFKNLRSKKHQAKLVLSYLIAAALEELEYKEVTSL